MGEENLTSGIYSLFGVIVGFLGSYMSSKTLLQIAEKNIQFQAKIEKEKTDQAFQEKELDRLRPRLEHAHQILSFISMENSMTVSFMESSGNLDIEAFHKRYLSNCEKLNELRAISTIDDIPKLASVLEEVYDLTNIFWGYQQWKMELLKSGSKAGANSSNQELQKVIFELPQKIKEAKHIIHEQSKELKIGS